MDEMRELWARTNPVFNTAKTTLMDFCLFGDEDARLLADRLGLRTDSVMGESEQKVVFGAANVTVIEARYRAMNNLIRATGIGTVVDLPCGYTPRALNEMFRDTHYIGCDLPAVIDALAPVMEELLRERGITRKEFHSVDATNYPSLRQALNTVQGELCVTTEGLIMYLSDSELRELCANIRAVLKEFGGCWLAHDPESSPMTMGIMKAMVGEEALRTMLAGWKAFSDKSDLPTRSTELNVMNVSALDYEAGVARLKDFLRSVGLRAERVPIARCMPQLNSAANLPAQTREALTRAIGPVCVWQMTVDPDYREAEADFSSEHFGVEVKVRGGAMDIALRGRLDSITAPEFLAAYERAAAEAAPERIAIDASALEYLSSAGLRVLFILIKQVGAGHLTVTGQNQTVREILEQTGFSEML